MSFDFFTDWRLRDLAQSVEHLRKASYRPNPFAPKQADIETLQQEVGELRLLVAALYRLLLDKQQFQMTEVLALLSSLDASDGKRDGIFHGDPISGEARAPEPPDDNSLPKIRVT